MGCWVPENAAPVASTLCTAGSTQQTTAGSCAQVGLTCVTCPPSDIMLSATTCLPMPDTTSILCHPPLFFPSEAPIEYFTRGNTCSNGPTVGRGVVSRLPCCIIKFSCTLRTPGPPSRRPRARGQVGPANVQHSKFLSLSFAAFLRRRLRSSLCLSFADEAHCDRSVTQAVC